MTVPVLTHAKSVLRPFQAITREVSYDSSPDRSSTTTAGSVGDNRAHLMITMGRRNEVVGQLADSVGGNVHRLIIPREGLCER